MHLRHACLEVLEWALIGHRLDTAWTHMTWTARGPFLDAPLAAIVSSWSFCVGIKHMIEKGLAETLFLRALLACVRSCLLACSPACLLACLLTCLLACLLSLCYLPKCSMLDFRKSQTNLYVRYDFWKYLVENLPNIQLCILCLCLPRARACALACFCCVRFLCF